MDSSLQRKLRGLTGKPRTERSLLNPRGAQIEAPLLEQDSSLSAGGSTEGRTRVRFGLHEDQTTSEGKIMPQMLIETWNPSVFVMTEARAQKGSGKMVARGEFGRVGTPTENGRIYSEALMGREIKRLSEDLKGRRVLGELDHPTEGKTSLKRVSHVVTDLWIENGIVMGEAEILGTREGLQLRALIEANIPIGVSSRGFGSTKVATGKVEGEEVQDDFILKTYDFVADPAVRTAIPGITLESMDEPTAAQLFLADFPEVAKQIQEDAVAKAKDKVAAGVDAAVEAEAKRVRDEMTETFEGRLAAVLVEAREDLGKQLREEFAADPGVGAAKATLAQIAEMVGAFRQIPDEKAVRDAMKAKEMEVAERTKERDEAIENAQQATLLLAVEKQIGGHPMAESIRGLLAGVKLESSADVEAKLAAIMEHLPQQEPGPSEAEAQLREENATLRGEVSLLQEKAGSLDERLKRAVELAQKVNTQLKMAEDRVMEAEGQVESLQEEKDAAELEAYKAKRVAGLVNGQSVLGLLEGVTSETEVDKVVARHGSTEISDRELREMRQRHQRGSGDARELDEDLKRPSRSRADDVDEFGVSFDLMRQLSGFTK